MAEPTMTGHRTKLALRLAAGLAVAAALLASLDLTALARTIRHVDLPIWGCAIVAAICANAASAWRWARISHAMATPVSWPQAWRIYAEAITLSNVLPGATLGGDAWRALQLNRLGSPMRAAVISVLADRLAGLWVVAALSALAWAFLGHSVPLELWIARLYGLILAGILVGLPVAAMIAARMTARTDALKAWLDALLPSIPVQILSMLAFGLCLQAAAIKIDILTLAWSAGFVFISLAIPISIAGWGLRETAAVVILAGLGIAAENATIGAALYGLAATVQALLALPFFLKERGAVRDKHQNEI